MINELFIMYTDPYRVVRYDQIDSYWLVDSPSGQSYLDRHFNTPDVIVYRSRSQRAPMVVFRLLPLFNAKTCIIYYVNDYELLYLNRGTDQCAFGTYYIVKIQRIYLYPVA